MLWHELSSPAIDALDKNLPVVVPIASCEQHGQHLPVFVDTIQVHEIATRVEAEMSDRILLVPSLWLGSSHHHKDFAGTISVRPSLFSEIIMSIAESILNTGFRRIVFLNGHGGNVMPGSAALSELVVDNDDADNAYLCLSSWWAVAQNSISQDKIESVTAGVSHACEFETSLMLHVRPDLVDMTKIKPWTSPLSSKWHTIDSISNPVPIFRRFHRLTDSGHMGKPEAATADKGKAICDAAVSDLKAFLTEMSTWPELPVIKRS